MAFDTRPIEILLVEDDLDHTRLVQQGLEDARAANHLSVVTDGDQALAFMRHQSPYVDAPRPDLVLLDLNLPGDGRDVLQAIKGDERLRDIPVIVMTSSQQERDILAAYKARANAYVVKPANLDAFMHMVRVLERFWLTVVSLPGRVGA